jgi:plastocyanin
MATRRAFVQAGGLAFAGFAVPRVARADVVEVHMKSDAQGAEVWFDPIGLLIAPGQTVRWVVDANVHTTTAYHPNNDMHSLRIPETATPWDSGFLMNPGQHFSVTLTVEGVYDYYCMPHEEAGMVGRIVVGRPDGPGALPFDYFKGRPDTSHWKSVPLAAQKRFPSVDVILKQRTVRRNPTEPLRLAPWRRESAVSSQSQWGIILAGGDGEGAWQYKPSRYRFVCIEPITASWLLRPCRAWSPPTSR